MCGERGVVEERVRVWARVRRRAKGGRVRRAVERGRGGTREEGGARGGAQGTDACVCVPFDRVATSDRRYTGPLKTA